MRRPRWLPWPGRLLGQMVVLVILALLLAQGISLWLLSQAHEKALAGHHQKILLRQVAAVVELLENTPEELHGRVLSVWRRPGVRFSISNEPEIAPSASEEEVLLASALQDWLGEPDLRRIRLQLQVAPEEPDEHRHRHRFREFEPRRLLVPVKRLLVGVQLNRGGWLQLSARGPAVPRLAAGHTVMFSLISLVLVVLVLIWRLRHITRPLGALTIAASRLGRGEKVSHLDETGPEDVQTTIRAFNTMNERVERFVSERTRMLAALSHDLRTPITSMRLRLELMSDSPERDQLLASLDEMQQMSESTLAFIRESGDVESAQVVDVAALLASVCDDLSDMGLSVQFDYGEPALLSCRPVSLKRALRNIIENAIKYGQHADVTLTEKGDEMIIGVQDQGPGIDPSLSEKVFEPFFRGESSRNRKTGGVGLGLSIARQIITNHGGDIQLHNSNAGLLVVIQLPRQ